MITIEDAIYKHPLSLKSIKNQEILNIIEEYLPYSTGFEIECNYGTNFNINNFKNIENIIEVSCDSDEQRFRIPKGIKGLICLYEICKQLKLNSTLNLESGIHYHIDMTDTFYLLNKELVELNEEWILEELDKWDYKGTYNIRKCRIDYRCWLQFQTQFNTAEIRIGEMTFDYELICKRIIDGNRIIKQLNNYLLCTPSELKIKELQNKLNTLSIKKVSEVNQTEQEIKKIINNRIVKINGKRN